MLPLTDLPWRTGRKLGRTVYAMMGEDASDDDIFVGIMENSELAEAVVEEHNRSL